MFRVILHYIASFRTALAIEIPVPNHNNKNSSSTARDVGQWETICLVSVRPWVYLIPNTIERKKMMTKEREKGKRKRVAHS